MNKNQIKWKKVSEYSNSFIIAFIAFCIFVPISYVLIILRGEKIELMNLLLLYAIILIIFLILIGFIIRLFSPKYYTFNQSSILLKYRNKIIEYKWNEIKRIKYSKPWNIEIHLKNGEKDGLILSTAKIIEILNEVKKHNINIQ